MSRISLDNPVPAVAICGYSGSGKTSLIENTLPLLVSRGLAVAYLKADAHRVDIDEQGKDSQRARHAGAAVSFVSRGDGPDGISFHHGDSSKPPAEIERRLIEHASRCTLRNLEQHFQGCHLLLVEGMKYSALPKILVNRLDNPCGILPATSLRRVQKEIRLPDLAGELREAAKETIGILESVIDTPSRRAARGVAGVVLAGGSSSRLELDKALLPVAYPDSSSSRGTWLERAVCLLTRYFGEVAIAGRVIAGGESELPNLKREVKSFADRRPGAGPLAGIESALQKLGSAALVLPCDLPLFAEETIELLLGGRDNSAAATVFRTDDGLPMPLPMIIEIDALEPLTRYLDSGSRSIAGFLQTISTKQLPLPRELQYQLTNINSPEDLESLY